MLPKVSDANQWMKCYGSVRAQHEYPGLPGEPSQSKLEGRACHEAAQQMFDGVTPDSIIGTLSRDGIVITRELVDVARVYVDDVRAIVGKYDPTIEQRVDLSHIIPEWYGIPDAWYLDPFRDRIFLWDFKAGHTFVPAVENWSLLLYLSGVINKLNLTDDDLYGMTFDLRIVQPRCYTSDGVIRTWTLAYSQFFNAEQRVINALKYVLSDNPRCTVGSQCKNCSARAHCTTLQRASYEGVDYGDALNTHDLTGNNLGIELKMLRRAAELIGHRLAGLEEQALHEIQSGQPVAFFGVKQGKGRERWCKDAPVEQIIMMGDLLGVDIRKPVELDTPAQARKKGIDDTVISEYSETPLTGMKLVEVDSSHVASVFTAQNEA